MGSYISKLSSSSNVSHRSTNNSSNEWWHNAITATVTTSIPLLLLYYMTTRTTSQWWRSSNKQSAVEEGSSTKTSRSSSATPLLQPAMEGKLDTLQSLIQQHVYSILPKPKPEETRSTEKKDKKVEEEHERIRSFVNESDGEGNTALIGAAFAGHLSVVQYLIHDCGADIRRRNNMECSPLWIAAGYGHASIVDCLIHAAAASTTTTTATTTASGGPGGEEEVLRLIQEPNNTGDTPLLAAVSKGHTDVCRILLRTADEYGPSETGGGYDLLCQQNKAGDYPLSVCVGCGHDGPLLNLLLDREEWHFANTTTTTTTATDPQQQQQQQQRPLNAKNPKGLTPLLIACERNLPTVVEELVLRRNADTNVCDDRGMSPLAVAAFCGCEDVVRTLLSLMVVEDSNTETSATGNNDTNNNNKVLGRDILDRVDHQGCTPLWHAARTGNAKMVELLINAGADGTRKDDTNGLTPQEAAIKFKKDKVVDFFRSTLKA